MSSRGVDAAFGVFFVALAGAVVAFADVAAGAGALVVAALLALLGADSLLASLANRRSLLSRIGPLP